MVPLTSHFKTITGSKWYDVMLISILASETETSLGTSLIKYEHYSSFARQRWICIMYNAPSDFCDKFFDTDSQT